MHDLVYVAAVIAFFAIAVGYVRGCARIVGEGDVVRVADDPRDGTDVGAAPR